MFIERYHLVIYLTWFIVFIFKNAVGIATNIDGIQVNKQISEKYFYERLKTVAIIVE